MDSTFHRRELKAPSISFSSPKGKALFRDSLTDGFLEGYYSLAENYLTQVHVAFCGLGSLTMALNSLLVDPGRVWQGVWRWFDESMLDCCEPLEVVKVKGIPLSKLACLARCNGANCFLKFANTVSKEQFRDDIITASSDSGADRNVIIASYSRPKLNQTGSGHFSPIGAYNKREDMVLIMDVARFKYPAHWVPLEDLYNAMNTIDPDTGNFRGYLVLSRGEGINNTISACECCPEGVPESPTDTSVVDTTIFQVTITDNTNLSKEWVKAPPQEDANLVSKEKGIAEVKERIAWLDTHTCQNCCHSHQSNCVK